MKFELWQRIVLLAVTSALFLGSPKIVAWLIQVGLLIISIAGIVWVICEVEPSWRLRQHNSHKSAPILKSEATRPEILTTRRGRRAGREEADTFYIVSNGTTVKFGISGTWRSRLSHHYRHGFVNVIAVYHNLPYGIAYQTESLIKARLTRMGLVPIWGLEYYLAESCLDTIISIADTQLNGKRRAA
jgi:hypothetical protein